MLHTRPGGLQHQRRSISETNFTVEILSWPPFKGETGHWTLCNGSNIHFEQFLGWFRPDGGCFFHTWKILEQGWWVLLSELEIHLIVNLIQRLSEWKPDAVTILPVWNCAKSLQLIVKYHAGNVATFALISQLSSGNFTYLFICICVFSFLFV